MKVFVRILVLVYLLFPIYWGINTSLKTENERISSTTYIVQNPTFVQYDEVLNNPFLLNALVNSTVVSCVSVAIALILGSSAGYALGRLQFRGKHIILLVILSMTMFPQISILTGLFFITRELGSYGSLNALFFTYPLLTLPISIWFFTYFIRQIPICLEEAAHLDGATFMQFYRLVLLPILRPAIISVGIITFVLVWNEYLYALTFTIISPEAQTITVAITQEGTVGAAILLTVPIIVIAFLFQKEIVATISEIYGG